jgi:uroporphyrinogen-III synthase
MILNTRPEIYRDRFHEAFAELELPILDCPVLMAEPIGVALPNPEAFDAVIITSQFAASIFSSLRDWHAKKTYAVGQGTADAALAAGFDDVTCTGEDAADMELRLVTEPFQRALYASAQDVTKDLSEVFLSRVTRLPIYRMTPIMALSESVESKIKCSSYIIAPLFSPRSAAALVDIFRKIQVTPENAQVYAVGISRDIFAAEEGPWQGRAVASSPTLGAMVAKTRGVAQSIGLISKVK